MTIRPLEAAVLVLLAMLSLAISAHAAEEVRDFSIAWCSPNRFRQSSDVDQICYGEVTYDDNTTAQAIGFRLLDGPPELYVEADTAANGSGSLSFDIIGPVQNSFSTELGHVQLSLDDDDLVNAVQGKSPRHGKFGAFRDSRNEMP